LTLTPLGLIPRGVFWFGVDDVVANAAVGGDTGVVGVVVAATAAAAVVVE
jgi:hypothetical protein